jgi:serine/threonine protein kinase
MELIEMAEVEIKSLQMMRDNLNILELKHALKTKNSIYIVTELCLKGTLSETLSPVCKFTEANAIRCILQIINGYKSIHSNQIIHRDIKPDNIFVTDKDRLKIGDFGFAIQSADCQQPTRDNMGSPLYMSYEALTRN